MNRDPPVWNSRGRATGRTLSARCSGKPAVVGRAGGWSCWRSLAATPSPGARPRAVPVAVAVARRRAGWAAEGKIICAGQCTGDLGRRNQSGRSFGKRSAWLTRGQHGRRPARPVARSAEFPTGRMAIIGQARCNQLRPAPQQLDAKRFPEILVQEYGGGGSGALPDPPAGEKGSFDSAMRAK
jgi:hypothetical protein